MPATANIGLNVPIIGSNNWGTPLNFNFTLLDQLLSGLKALPGLSVNGNATVTGTITAGAFSGLDGSLFLTSALFDQPNGIPQLNGTGTIPASLIAGLSLVTVASSSTPAFNAALGQAFKLILTQDATSSTFVNGAAGPAMIGFRIQQDGSGGHAFAWPANVRNGGIVNPGPNARSVQMFLRDTDGSLDAVGPIMYS
jgi:hypothetical protein